ncbi:efflux RND transporter periplasmic adaptor subunit [Methylobacterium soli]|uniref:Efflux RND transporter periplasmic adaptor subunit n=1 Tax=Methylobacterium soli TaxID=553447 RepID=A0A6L3T2C2_9HYPH|nr:efflux RND transporter periplasmic adaptor subunit [Methylobacterium soli]KAB1080882.1 efflux RND transporter periplasmic adaptor subunit [Methylobacterium soli]GJE45295.1 Multidrug resistance protein MdtA [Methylobacterium soli]
MQKRAFLLAAVLLVITGVVFEAEHIAGAPHPAQAAVPIPAVPVVASDVVSRDVPIYLDGVGTVIAFNNVVVRSQITGQLTKITFVQGQSVKAGDLLAQIDPRPYQAEVDQMTANLNRDQAQLINSQANLNRYTPLLAKGYATSQLVDTQKAQVAQLQAAVQADEALVRAMQVNLSYTNLTSPIDGVTGIRQIDQGNIIHPTDVAGLVDVTQIQPISMIFTLPQTNFVEIQQEMARGPVKVLAYSQDGTKKLDEGTLLLIDNQIVQTTGTIRLRATFANAQRLLWPGEFVNARLLLRTQKDGLTVPASAVQQGPAGSYVYAIAADQTVQMRPVKIAQISGGQALIASGVNATEKVVVDGQYRLQPGSHIDELHGKAAQQADLQSAVERAIP